MKILNKQELQQNVFNYSSNILTLKIDLMNLCKKYSAKPRSFLVIVLCSFLVIDTTLASDNPLRFSRNFLESIKANHDNW